MTIIAAVHQNGETWIGSDSLRHWGETKIIGADKIILGPGIAVGVSGNAKAQQVIRRNADKILADCDEHAVAQRIRAALDEDKWATMSPEGGKGPQDYGFVSLIALPTQVYLMSGDFLLQPIEEGELMAAGSGCDYALGAGSALRWSSAYDRVTAAVEAAIKWDSGCGGRIHIHRIADPAVASLKAAQ